MIAKEINGPSWSIKQKIDIDEIEKRIEENEKKLSSGSAMIQKLIQKI